MEGTSFTSARKQSRDESNFSHRTTPTQNQFGSFFNPNANFVFSP